MFNLYKIDFAGDSLDTIQDFNIGNLTIKDVDRGFSHADRLVYDFGDEKKELKETTVEKNKIITTKYLETVQDPTKARELANTIYEFLAEERGLDENIPTSKELDGLVDKSDLEDNFRNSIRYEVQGNEEHKKTNDDKIMEAKNKNEDKEADERE